MQINANVLYWQNKLQALSSTSELENIGKNITAEQVLDLLTYASMSNDDVADKIIPLFVGISSMVFREFLKKITKNQCDYIKKIVMTEALLHHLTVLSHQLLNETQQYSDLINAERNELESLPFDNNNVLSKDKWSQKIHSLADLGLSLIKEIQTALSLAWNANRPDLLKRLNDLNENIVKTHKSVLNTNEPLGLVSLLNSHFDRVYTNDLEHRIDIAEDDEPALEALAKLSLWYASDYWDIGLLPEISKSEPEINNPTENDKIAMREKVLVTVENNLRKIGLFTTQDLKNKGIYSKETLATFIKENRDKLR